MKNLWHVNDYEIKENFAEIILRNNKNVEVARSKIDVENIKDVLKYKWGLTPKNYARNTTPLCTNIHNFVLGSKKGFLVDHINGDTLDNRLINLRFVTLKQNSMNRKCRGFDFLTKEKKWRARINVNGKRVVTPRRKTMQEAYADRVNLEKNYFGKYARVR